MEVDSNKVLREELFQASGVYIADKEDVFMIELAGRLLWHFQSFESCAVDENKACVDWLEPRIGFEGDLFEARQSDLQGI